MLFPLAMEQSQMKLLPKQEKMISEINGFSNYYCTSEGNLFTRNWKNQGVTRKMKPAPDHKGYLKTVMVDENGKHHAVRVHRVIAGAFIPNPKDKPFVNHINGVKDDNRVDNLEWATAKENTAHAIDNGLFSFSDSIKSKNITPKKGELNGCSKLTEKEVKEIRRKFKPRIYTRDMLACEYKVKASTIKDVVIRKSWKHI